MRWNESRAPLAAAACAAVALCAGAILPAQQPPAGQAPPGQGRGGGGGGGPLAPRLFLAVDGDKDGAVTRAEMQAAFGRWFTEWDTAKAGSLGQDEIAAGLNTSLPAAPAAQPTPGAECGGRSSNPQTACPQDVQAMIAALPATAPAKPRQPRRVLVLAKSAGFVHSSIPLAARSVEELGKKTGAWTATTSWNPADVNEQNLKQYDAIFLASTTGHFLDDPNDAAATEARKKALLDFVRGGKGVVGIHAATDSYHRTGPAPAAAPPPAASTTPNPGQGRAGGGRGPGGGRGGGQTATLAAQFVSQGDKNSDQRLSLAEFTALSDAWFDRMTPDKVQTVSQADFAKRFAVVMPPPAPQGQGRATRLEPDTEVGTWPEWNNMIGGFFKFHWNDGQQITYKIDEPNHPLNAPFKKVKLPFVIADETYTFGRETYSRKNLRILTSIDYNAMSAEDKAKESNPRADGDYGLSWIKRDGKGRVFYMAHGHNEKIYANTPLMEHLLYGMQYALGDLQADDSPSVK